MADAGPHAPDIPAPQAPQDLQQPTQQMQQMSHLNWSHFKPGFSGKPEDAETHLLRTNNWMNIHQFQDGIKVKDFA